jgi:hypothetical protein
MKTGIHIWVFVADTRQYMNPEDESGRFPKTLITKLHISYPAKQQSLYLPL